MSDADAIVREIKIEAKPETLFPFFTDPDQMTRWMGIEAWADPKPGGIYRVRVSQAWYARGEFVEVVPNERVVYTWGWEMEEVGLPPGSTTVEITLHPEGEHTIVRLRHFGLPASSVGEHTQGWDHYFSRLALVAVGRDPGPDPWASPQ